MSKEKSSLVYGECAVSVDEGSVPFLPLMAIIRWAMEKYKDEAIPETIQVCSYIEISEQDYEEFIELRKSQGWRDRPVTIKQ